MNSDIKIAQETKLRDIKDVKNDLGLLDDDVILYGNDKLKIKESALKHKKHNSKLILVTAITPTKAGEGKTTLSIGLAEALKRRNVNVCLALREPSLGPVMGLKGGATGGGYAQVLPMESINLHFTGDFHAITSANNLVSAVIDNEIYYNSSLNIDPDRVVWKRCLDVNDRSLREVKVGMGSKFNGVERDENFRITVATEMMAIFCLAKDFKDLEERLNRAVIAYDKDGNEVYLKQLNITGSLLLLLKDAFKPNLVQTVEGGPAIIHGGPFANIAHGCNSIIATKYAMHLSDVVVTEAGFGADLGLEKFLDIKARTSGIEPDIVCLVATIRALKMHGGVEQNDLTHENVEAMLKGIDNLNRHIETIKNFNKRYIVAINRFASDTDNEVLALENYLKNNNHPYSLATVFSDGGLGGLDLADKVIDMLKVDDKPSLKYLYDVNDTIQSKILNICQKAYGAKDVEYSQKALIKIEELEKKGYDKLLICMAKTQNSVTDNKDLLNAPKDFTIHVKDISLSLGAGFIVVYTGKIITMPGLPEDPACKHMGIDDNNESYGIF